MVTDGSWARAQKLIETLLPKVSRQRHSRLLFWLGKCYLSASRYTESLKCLELSLQLLTEHNDKISDVLKTKSLVYLQQRKID